LLHSLGATAGVQLGHAGAKSATPPPWVSEEDRRPASQWPIESVTDEPHAPGWQRPNALTSSDLEQQLRDWVAAAKRAANAGFDVLEIHAAHGYLLHSFLSPLSNTRTDEFGGSLRNRMRYPLAVVDAVRAVWPDDRPLLVRLSVVDNSPGGLTVEDSVEIACAFACAGVDVIDCSSGGIGSGYSRPIGPGYQVEFAQAVRAEAHIATMAVGMVVDPHQADDIVTSGAADLVALGRQALVDPSWPLRACDTLAPDSTDRYSLLAVQSRSWVAKRDRQLARFHASASAEQPCHEPSDRVATAPGAEVRS
ncbi:NADH:flavin oxidoreductase/NADH oxidase, partial [Gordonia sp. i37]|uniref:oxidoreductase n=1 Tax=Gordonia sp. i37 TaxID=1961707 RepID=UPI001119CFFA